ncbi:hypothetical protein KC19_VG177800 [Ceratodon purpureus]|nr:hypothetical protein KC19_VG177800 [Ceratodon purpureus]KAG0573431.1 hypothetical protein KC19_VG177800 [Ceratodon purpureus]
MMMRQPAIVEEEHNNAINYPTEQRVERMFAALKNRISIQPVFICVILPDKDSPIYGHGEASSAERSVPRKPGIEDQLKAVVATKNWPDVFHYSTQVRTQPAETEMIEGLYEPGGDMVRDGVSKSQFQECLEFEFTALKRACEDLEEGYNPGITFIVAQKRHSTRFFPQGNDKTQKGNCVPGTVVDKDACHPHNYDFFLISQNGFIGTSRPTHYHVLVTENKHLKPDDIQSVTNNLCYT